MDNKSIHIGNYVRQNIKDNGGTLADIARKAGISKERFNNWCNKDDWYVKDLFTISQASGIDFVKIFCQPEEGEQDTKVVLHIEIEKSKANDVLKYIKDKQLYSILKNKENSQTK